MSNEARQTAATTRGPIGMLSSLLGTDGDGPLSTRALATLATLIAAFAFLAFGASPAAAKETHVFKSSFGEPCAASPAPCGAGQLALDEHSGVAVDDATGDVYVADTGNRRVDEFSPTGSFIRAFGADVGGAGVDVCTTTCVTGTETSAPGGFDAPTFIAVDNSSDPSKEDVYVGDPVAASVTKFTAEGTLISSWGTGGQLTVTPVVVSSGTGTTTEATAEVTELAMTANAFIPGEIITGAGIPAGTEITEVEATRLGLSAEVTASATDVSLSASSAVPFTELGGIAVDSSGNLDVFKVNPHLILRFSQDGSFIEDFETVRGSQSAGLAVDPSGDFFKINGTPNVEKLGPDGTAVGQVSFEAGEFEGKPQGFNSDGLATDPSTGELYVTGGSAVHHFKFNGAGEVLEPTSSACMPGGPGEGCEPTDNFGSVATGQGELEAPGGIAVTSSHDVYVADAGRNRIDLFIHAILPDVATGPAATVTRTSATLTGTIDPAGLPVSGCAFEITEGEGDEFSSRVPCVESPASIGAGQSPVAVHAELAGLAPYRLYSFRLLGENAQGSEVGQVATFTTVPEEEALGGCPNETLRRESFSLALPDCRAYELVSPADSRAEVALPMEIGLPGGELKYSSFTGTRAGISGEGLVYVAEPPDEGGNGAQGNGLGDQWIAARGPSGWESRVLTPAAQEPASTDLLGYDAFSADLSKSVIRIIQEDDRGHVPALAPGGPADCRMLYLHSGFVADTGFRPLITETQEGGAEPKEACGRPILAGTTPDFSEFVFQTEAALTPGSSPAPGSEEHIRQARLCTTGCNLYASLPDGSLELIDQLPGAGHPQAGGATFGGPAFAVPLAALPPGLPDLEGVLSDDGSRAFWTDTTTGDVYLRAGVGTAAATTIPVSLGPAQFWAATPDGRYAYYTEEGALIRFSYDAGTVSREILVEASGETEGVIGINHEGPDGDYLYFVAGGDLTGAQQNSSGAVAREGGHNLYLLHEGRTIFIATLSTRDDAYDALGFGHDPFEVSGAWQTNLGERTAQVSADGRALIFESDQALTRSNRGLEDFSAYDFYVPSGLLSCVSCDPSGAKTSGAQSAEPTLDEDILPTTTSPLYQRRLISADGSRVFFQDPHPLLPSDTNQTMDLYEWQRQGTEGCPPDAASPFDGGCVGLISDGGGESPSVLIEADRSGENVFFATTDQLLPAAGHEQMRMFDARVGGGFPALVQVPPCEGNGACRAGSSEAPPGATPTTQHFSAAEAVPAPCRRGRVDRHGRCLKHHRHRHRHKKRRRGHRQAPHRHTDANRKGGLK